MQRFDVIYLLGRYQLFPFPVDVFLVNLSLQIERLSKSVVEKRADLQNLEAESSAKQVSRAGA